MEPRPLSIEGGILVYVLFSHCTRTQVHLDAGIQIFHEKMHVLLACTAYGIGTKMDDMLKSFAPTYFSHQVPPTLLPFPSPKIPLTLYYKDYRSLPKKK